MFYMYTGITLLRWRAKINFELTIVIIIAIVTILVVIHNFGDRDCRTWLFVLLFVHKSMEWHTAEEFHLHLKSKDSTIH